MESARLDLQTTSFCCPVREETYLPFAGQRAFSWWIVVCRNAPLKSLRRLTSTRDPAQSEFSSIHTGTSNTPDRMTKSDAAGAKIIAQENTRLWMSREILVEWQNNKIYPPRAKEALPNDTFFTHESPRKMSFGNEQIQYGHMFQAHTDGDIYVFFPGPNILMAGDVLSVGKYPILDYSTHGWIGGMANANRDLLQIVDDQTKIIPGTGPDTDESRSAGAVRHVVDRTPTPCCNDESGLRRQGHARRHADAGIRRKMGRPDIIYNQRISRDVGTCPRAGRNHLAQGEEREMKRLDSFGDRTRRAGASLPTVPRALRAALPVPQQQAGSSAITEHQALINQYCVTCHNQKTKTAGLTLDTMNLAEVGKDARIWEEAVRKLRGGMMPPPGARQPEKAAVKSFVSWLETSLDRAAAEHPSPGRVALHRMNRVEYANAVERIFGLHVDASSLLPVDDISDGFDNIASVLKVSPSFLDQYISAARAVTSRALGNPTARPVGLVYRASGADQSSYMEGQPLGTRGGMLIEHTFPADGEYVFDIGNLATGGYVLNMDTKHRVLLTIDGLKVFEASLGGEVDLKAIDQSQPQAAAVEAINARFKNIRIGVKSGIRKVGVTFVARSAGQSDSVLQPFVPGSGVDRIPRIQQLQIAGPYAPAGVSDTPSRQRVFICTPRTWRKQH